jgi:hypothetical protein
VPPARQGGGGAQFQRPGLLRLGNGTRLPKRAFYLTGGRTLGGQDFPPQSFVKKSV